MSKKRFGFGILIILNLLLFALYVSAQDTDLDGHERLQGSPALSEEEQRIISETNEPAPSRFNFSWVYLTPIIVIGLFLAYVEIKRLMEHNALTQQHNQQKINGLRIYVSSTLRKGYSNENIKDALSRSGYSNREIEEAFRRIR